MRSLDTKLLDLIAQVIRLPVIIADKKMYKKRGNEKRGAFKCVAM